MKKKKKYSVSRPHWFRAKHFGWGWYPVCWQGWVVIVLYLADVATLFYLIDHFSHSVSDTLTLFFPYFLLLTAILIMISFLNGEKPQFRWGKPKK